MKLLLFSSAVISAVLMGQNTAQALEIKQVGESNELAFANAFPIDLM